MIFLNKFFLLLCSAILVLLFFSHPLFAQESTTIVFERVTVSDYCKFLKHVALSDEHGLYDPKMACDPPMIDRSGVPGAYSYHVSKGADPNGAILYVNRVSQARYCNWKEGGETEVGVYNLAAILHGSDALDSDFQASPNAHYLLSNNNNLLATADPMLGLGNGMAYFMMNHVVAVDTTTEKNAGASIDQNASLTEVVTQYDSSLSGISTPPMLLACAESSTLMDENSAVAITNPHPLKIDLAVIDDPGNQYDSAQYGMLGAVDTTFQMASNDITAEQYATFLNAVATSGDPYEIYDPNMGSDPAIACLTQNATATNYDSNNTPILVPPFSYTPIPGREKFPITYITGLRAAEFCNWMENGQPIGVEGPATTESGSFAISYRTNYITSTKTIYVRNPNGTYSTTIITNTNTQLFVSLIANTNALWTLPTEDQFYKAAYYKKPKVGIDGWTNRSGEYFLYGTGHNESPTNTITIVDRSNNIIQVAATNKNDANFCLDGSYTMSNPPYVTPVGMFQKTKSPFGLYDMSGNVDQWTLYQNGVDTNGNPVWCLGLRGGSWNSDLSQFHSSANGAIVIDTGELGVTSMRRVVSFLTATNTIGFRLVYNAPPPPESLLAWSAHVSMVLAARTWDWLKEIGYACNPFYFIPNMSDASMTIFTCNFATGLLEFGSGAFLTILNIVKIAAGQLELVAGRSAFATLVPPPFGGMALITMGLVGAYTATSPQNASSAIGLVIAGVVHLFI